MKKNINKNKYGFSLIETMIAVSILMIAIAGPLSLVQAGLFSSIRQRSQVTATYLAQEAFEYIKNMRDSNSYDQYVGGDKSWQMSVNGADELSDICGGTGCYVDPHGGLSGSSNIKAISESTTHYLNKVVLLNGAFSYTYAEGGTPTTYKRIVKITPVSADGTVDELKVTVTVEWKDNAIPREYIVRGNIYNYAQ